MSSIPAPYDPSTLQDRIQAQLGGIADLSAYLKAASSKQRDLKGSKANIGREEMDQMVRMHLGNEWWADLLPEEAEGFLERKEAALKAVQAAAGHSYSSFNIPSLPAPPESAFLSSSGAAEAGSSKLPVLVASLTADKEAGKVATLETVAERIGTGREQNGKSNEKEKATLQNLAAALDNLPAELREPMQRILKEDVQEGGHATGEVTEEGLPVMEIVEKVESKGKRAERAEPVKQKVVEGDDYWSPAAKAKRERLRRMLLDSDEEDEEQGHGSAKSGTRAGSSRAAVNKPQPKPGFMISSRVVEHLPDEDEVEAPSEVMEKNAPPTAKGKGKADEESARFEVVEEDKASSQEGKRRKSVAFAPEAVVRTYEKGEAMPAGQGVVEGAGSDIEATSPLASQAKQSLGSEPQSGAQGKPISAVAGMRKGFLLAKSQTPKPAPSTTKPSPPTPAPSARSPATYQPSGFGESPDFRSEIVIDPSYTLDPEIQARTQQIQARSIDADTTQPLAPAHEDEPRQKQSLFAMRQQAYNMPGPFTRQPESADAREPVKTGASSSRLDSGTMKFQVVEKAPKPVERKAVGRVMERNVSSGSQRASQDSGRASGSAPVTPQQEGKVNLNSIKQEEATSQAEEPVTGIDGDEDSASEHSLEYSDTDEVNLDLDNALMAREAALAYHQKRSQLGRSGLGGWQGVGHDGETEFYDGETGETMGNSRAVKFGEMVVPQDRYKKIQDYVEADGGGEGDGPLPPGLVLPTLPPGAESLPDMIRVGKLENGNLIVAGENEESGDEAEVEVVEKPSRKADIIGKLGRGEVADLLQQESGSSRAAVIGQEALSVEPVSASDFKKKAFGDAVVEKGVTSGVKSPSRQKEPVDDVKPKKVSRFKAARMAGGA